MKNAIKKAIDESKPKVRCKLVPLNKVRDQCEGDDGNTTLLAELNEVQSLASLDSGASSQIWEAWGKLTLRKPQMKL